MAVLFSPSKCGFYTTEMFESDAIPDDAVTLSEQQYNAALTGLSEGGTISPGADGYPVVTKQ